MFTDVHVSDCQGMKVLPGSVKGMSCTFLSTRPWRWLLHVPGAGGGGRHADPCGHLLRASVLGVPGRCLDSQGER